MYIIVQFIAEVAIYGRFPNTTNAAAVRDWLNGS